MNELMLVKHNTGNVIPANTITFELTPSGTATAATFIFTRVIGTITYDVPGSTPISTAGGNNNVAISIPADATRLYLTAVVNETGAGVPAIITSATFGQNSRITGIASWGQMDTRFNLRLQNCRNLVKVPITSPRWTSWNYFFSGCTSFNQDISQWDTSHVTAMGYMFQDCAVFNKPLGSWNTVSVASMLYMFKGATAFNQNISTWNVANVTNMGFMFNLASSFNQNLSNLTFPRVGTGARNSYDTGATSWQANFKPTFAIV